ncbi:MAG TPA: hypothetical protein PK624_11945 [Spirochaetota bacterium]|nr:hypothetical protein [Spirochaetota bacterium]HOR45494.1 hypothetical protein [Spirochaetota bacterium]HPK57161.1 hypothetical protein [Spirochaetota bacterium]
MNNIFPVPLFDRVSIVENREYHKFFDESVNVYNEHYNKIFPFNLEYDYSNCSGKLEIPNCGGHVDSVPSSVRQLDWTNSVLSDLSVEQTWSTIWDIPSIELYSRIINKLTDNNSDIKSLYYQCGISGLRMVISHSLEIEHPIICLICNDNNKISKIDADDETNVKLQSLLFINTDDQYYDSLSRIMKTDNFSKSITFRVYFMC